MDLARWRTVGAAALAVGLCVQGARPSGQSVDAKLPGALESYATNDVKLTAAQRKLLFSGAPVAQLMEADPAKEVSVFGAVWIDAPAALYVAAVKDIENFEKGGSFRITKRISSPPRLDDFAQLTLPDDDVADLRTCKVGQCAIKLSEAGLERLRKEIDWSKKSAKADVEALARRMALEYVTGYLEGGNERLAVYRDSDHPTFVATEFKSMVDRMPSLTQYLPDLKSYLLGYPKVTLDNVTSLLYWQEAKFGLKPTIRINHVAIHERADRIAVVSKQLYASHYFWTALELRVLVPDPSRGRGFWFANVNRSRSDGLSGFVGRLIRGKVRGEAQKGMEAALKATKTSLEQRAKQAS